MEQKFKENQRVYGQTGEQFCYAHDDGEFAWVAPYFIIQVVSYHGDDFSEEEEVADHLIRVPLKTISAEPWAKSIHKETREAIEEHQEKLTKINAKVGAAVTALKEAENNLKAFNKNLADEEQALIRAYPEMAMFKRISGMENIWIIYNSRNAYGVPSFAGNVSEYTRSITFKRNEDGKFMIDLDEDGYSHARAVLTSEAQFQQEIRKMFHEREQKSAPIDAEWFKKFGFLNISPEAKALLKEEQEAADKKRQEQLEKSIKDAEAKLAAFMEAKDGA